MHRPWAYSAGLLNRFRDHRFTAGGLESRLREALDAAHELEEIAVAGRIPISEPFQGAVIGPFIVLSPERDWYLRELVPNFERTPEAKRPLAGLLGPLFRAAADAASWIAESLNSRRWARTARLRHKTKAASSCTETSAITASCLQATPVGRVDARNPVRGRPGVRSKA